MTVAFRTRLGFMEWLVVSIVVRIIIKRRAVGQKYFSSM